MDAVGILAHEEPDHRFQILLERQLRRLGRIDPVLLPPRLAEQRVPRQLAGLLHRGPNEPFNNAAMMWLRTMRQIDAPLLAPAMKRFRGEITAAIDENRRGNAVPGPVDPENPHGLKPTVFRQTGDRHRLG
jgi:hypothetical protein